jgi:hypothetical protein
VEFGVHVNDNKTVYKKIVVRNSGSAPASYKINYHGEHAIGFTPQSAVVDANASVDVEVTFAKIHLVDLLILLSKSLSSGVSLDLVKCDCHR